MLAFDPTVTALLICDMQNDFLHPEGAYARAGIAAPGFAALVPRFAGVAEAARRAGVLSVATQFTLVPGRGGEPFIAAHLKALRPFLKAGDFAPGSFGQDTLAALKPVDIQVEKVAYNAFHQSRLEWVLRHAGITRLIVGGIVTNGGVASTVRGAQVLEFDTVVMEDGCATIDPELHAPNIAALRSVAAIASCREVVAALQAA